MYAQKIRDAGFALYAQDLTFDDIAREMRKKYKDCKRLRPNSIRRWAEQDGWRQRYDAIRKASNAALDNKLIDDRARVIGQMREMRDRLLHEARRMKLKSAESAAWMALAYDKRIDEKTGERGKFGFTGDVQRVVMVIFEVLSQDEKVSEVFQAKEKYFLREIEQKLLQSGAAEVKRSTGKINVVPNMNDGVQE